MTGSYDKTIRQYDLLSGHSKEIYHTKRMQRVFSVKYSMDSSYIVSGSDDGNLRLWKAKASAKQGILAPREEATLAYAGALRDRFAHMPEMKKIERSRKIPVNVRKTQATKRVMLDSRKRKEENERQHKGEVNMPRIPERQKMVLLQDT